MLNMWQKGKNIARKTRVKQLGRQRHMKHMLIMWQAGSHTLTERVFKIIKKFKKYKNLSLARERVQGFES